MWSIAWLFIKSYWKPISIGLVAVGILGGLYLKGRADMRHKIEAEAAKETIHRIEEAGKVKNQYQKVKDQIHEKLKDPDAKSVDDCLSGMWSHPPTSEDSRSACGETGSN